LISKGWRGVWKEEIRKIVRTREGEQGEGRNGCLLGFNYPGLFGAKTRSSEISYSPKEIKRGKGKRDGDRGDI
jgi:hypothetical protein